MPAVAVMEGRMGAAVGVGGLGAAAAPAAGWAAAPGLGCPVGWGGISYF